MFKPTKRIIQTVYLTISLLAPAMLLLGLFRTVQAQPTSIIQSDDFNACSLDTSLWTFVNPLGDGAVTLTGAQAELFVPTGASHDVWSSGNFAPRLMQTANDADFEIEVKFESAVSLAYQLQGIIIEQDSANFLRFDFYHDGSATRVHAAVFVGGAPTSLVNLPLASAPAPMYLRVTRVGNQWTQGYSFDGQNWTTAVTFNHTLQVNQVGPFAGNAGSNPAHTAVIDYFFNTAAPIAPEDGLTITHHLAINAVGSGNATANPDKPSYTCNETAVLTASPDVGWFFAGWSGDLTGNDNPAALTMDSDKNITATFTAVPTYTLTVNTDGGGSVTVNPDQPGYLPNDVVTVTAVADPGWQFTAWRGDLTGSALSNTLTMTADKVITAAFTALPTYTVAIATVGGGSVNASPAKPDYYSGEQVALTAVPDYGWQFAHWALTPAWWDNNWRYRLPIQVNANGYPRADKPAEAAVNFTALLASLGQTNPVDVNSLRLIEVDADDQIIDPAVPFQFDQDAAFDAATNAAGTLVFLLNGATPNNGERLYHLYFETTGSSFAAPTFTPQITATDNVTDEGQSSFLIETAAADYYYHKDAGGFSSLVDRDGNDWINFHPTGGSAGDFRGIPNLVYPDNYFHPGFTNASSVLVNQGPLKTTIQSVSDNNLWETIWEIYPGYARLTVERIDHNYWFLYEGTPGGSLDTGSDIVVRSDGTEILAGGLWTGDIVGEEWVYFGDPVVGRSLYTINHQDDTAVDSYFPLDGQMTVFGFGRDGISSYLNQAPAQFTIGLADTTAFTQTAVSIRAAYKPLTVTTGTAVTRPTATLIPAPVLALTMTHNQAVTATFNAIPTYTLDIIVDGSGVVDVAPSQTSYLSGTQVVLTATTAADWLFDGWTGDLTGKAFTESLTMTADKIVTATFSAIPTYTLDIIVDGSGVVDVAPSQTSYLSGTQVVLTATAAADWQFDGWAGDLNGRAFTESLTMTADRIVTATFSAIPTYTLTINVDGSGAVDVAPSQTSYLSGTQVVLTATAAADWLFDGWTGDLNGRAFTESLTMTADRIVTATFSAIPTYTLTINVDGSGAVDVTPNQSSYLSGTQVILTATAAPDWAFSAWSGSATGSAISTTVTMTQNQVVNAAFIQIPLYLTVDVNGSGAVTVNPDQAAYVAGDVVTLTAQADAGWAFSGWGGALSGLSPSQTLTMTANTAVSATFTAIPTYTLDINIIGQGSVTTAPNQTIFLEGAAVTLTAEAAPGWRFVGWSGNLSGDNVSETLMMVTDINVTAVFAAVPTYTVAINVSGSGTVAIAPDQTEFLEGDLVTLTPVPAPGWRFMGWQGDITGNTDDPVSFTIMEDKEATAVFALKYQVFLPAITNP